MSLLPVIYCQRAEPGRLGSCGVTIADYGCWLCSNAMNLAKLSHPEANPQHLNGLWTNGTPGYVNGCDGWSGLPDATYQEVTLTRQGYGADYARTVDPATEAATVGVDAWAEFGYPTHFLAFDHVEGVSIICGDPWYGDLCNVQARYGEVTTIDVYRGQMGGAQPAQADLEDAYGGSVIQTLGTPQGRCDVLVVGGNGALWWTWGQGLPQAMANNATSLGGDSRAISALYWSDYSHITVSSVGTDGTVWYLELDVANAPAVSKAWTKTNKRAMVPVTEAPKG